MNNSIARKLLVFIISSTLLSNCSKNQSSESGTEDRVRNLLGESILKEHISNVKIIGGGRSTLIIFEISYDESFTADTLKNLQISTIKDISTKKRILSSVRRNSSNPLGYKYIDVSKYRFYEGVLDNGIQMEILETDKRAVFLLYRFS